MTFCLCNKSIRVVLGNPIHTMPLFILCIFYLGNFTFIDPLIFKIYLGLFNYFSGFLVAFNFSMPADSPSFGWDCQVGASFKHPLSSWLAIAMGPLDLVVLHSAYHACVLWWKDQWVSCSLEHTSCQPHSHPVLPVWPIHECSKVTFSCLSPVWPWSRQWQPDYHYTEERVQFGRNLTQLVHEMTHVLQELCSIV